MCLTFLIIIYIICFLCKMSSCIVCTFLDFKIFYCFLLLLLFYIFPNNLNFTPLVIFASMKSHGISCDFEEIIICLLLSVYHSYKNIQSLFIHEKLFIKTFLVFHTSFSLFSFEVLFSRLFNLSRLFCLISYGTLSCKCFCA